MFTVTVVKRSTWCPEGQTVECGRFETFQAAELKALLLAKLYDPIITGPNGEMFVLEEQEDANDPDCVLLYMVPKT